MTPPKLHHDAFQTRDEAPPMTTIEPGHRIRVEYTPEREDCKRQTTEGVVTHAGYGRNRDIITFQPRHRKNEWKVELDTGGLTLYYHHPSGQTNWRYLGQSVDEPVEARIKPAAPSGGW